MTAAELLFEVLSILRARPRERRTGALHWQPARSCY